MNPLRTILAALLATMIAGCETTPSDVSPGLTKLQAQLACPEPPSALSEDIPPPFFAAGESWIAWSDALLGWGAEEARRRHDLAAWYAAHCGGANV